MGMSNTSIKGDEAFAKRKAGVQKNELNEQLKDYINQWREERAKEEAELKRMKDKQAARKEIRAEQEKKRASTCEVQNRPELFHEQLTSICWAPIHSVKNHHRLHSSKIRHWGQCRNIESYLKKSGATNQTNSIQNKIHSLLRYCSKTSSNASLEIELF